MKAQKAILFKMLESACQNSFFNDLKNQCEIPFSKLSKF